MERFLSELRNKPYRYRKNVALGVAVVVSLVIFFVWAIATKARFDARIQMMAEKVASTTVPSPAELSSPLSAISQSISEGIETIKSQFEELSKIAE